MARKSFTFQVFLHVMFVLILRSFIYAVVFSGGFSYVTIKKREGKEGDTHALYQTMCSHYNDNQSDMTLRSIHAFVDYRSTVR